MMARMFFSSLITFLFFCCCQALADDNCLTCHQEFEDDSGPSHKYARDIHYQKGLGCVDCHGGDASLDDMDDVRQVRNYRGVPSHRQVPQFCARCHGDAAYMRNHNPSLPTDQLDKYRTSIHGKRLFENNDSKVANCVSCHAVHEIGDAKMPHSSTHPVNVIETCERCHSDADYMASYGIPTTQVDDYRASVHGRALLERNDLGAPACNGCHGNHGAAPPGVASLSAVCGNCHAIEAALFMGSPHMPAFTENDFPMCETCHSNHRIEKPGDHMVGTEQGAVCAECHSSDDGTIAFETAAAVSSSIRQLVASYSEAGAVLAEAIEKGMMTTDEEFRLKEVAQVITRSRTMVHAFDQDSVVSKTTSGIEKADTVRINSAALIDEYHFRRRGLGIATVFITIVAIALYIKIKRIERGQRRQ